MDVTGPGFRSNSAGRASLRPNDAPQYFLESSWRSGMMRQPESASEGTPSEPVLKGLKGMTSIALTDDPVGLAKVLGYSVIPILGATVTASILGLLISWILTQNRSPQNRVKA